MNSEKYISHTVMSLISAKGGVGTSTLTKELAIAFSKDVSVCLVDMALSCPAQETLFRILPTRTMEYICLSTKQGIFPLCPGRIWNPILRLSPVGISIFYPPNR